MKYILSLDQGTTSSRAILFDEKANLIAMAQKEFTQIFPKAAWVEHDPDEILKTQVQTAKDCIAKSGISVADIVAIGITNQRETVVVWDKTTGKAIHNAIVWQDRRTAEYCQELKDEGYEENIRKKTGLPIDAYFSASKIRWILDHVEGARAKAGSGELVFGTIDSWLIYQMSEGAVHCTDYSNASRTMLYNINTLQWDEDLFRLMDIPINMAPQIVDSSGNVGMSRREIFDASIPISGIAGDQQAALFGQACFETGMAKNTYGTGCFMLMHTGEKPFYSEMGLITTIAWSFGGKTEYALEGSVFNAGSCIQWLRDGLGIIQEASSTSEIASELESHDGVYLVPAFTGLGAPHWKMDARAIIMGMTRRTDRRHLVRAGLESIAYQSKDVFDLMVEESGISLQLLRVDGGASQNHFLMQFQADLLNVEVQRPRVYETTALGAAYLAGLALDIYDLNFIKNNWQQDKNFKPERTDQWRSEVYSGWLQAVRTCINI